MVEWTSYKSAKECHTASFTFSRFSSVITMLVLPLLFTYWHCLSNYDVRYLCAYIKSHSSDVSSVNAVEATFAVITYIYLYITKYVIIELKNILDKYRIFREFQMDKIQK